MLSWFEATEEWGRAGAGNIRELGEDSDIETEGLRKEGLGETPSVWWTVLMARCGM